MANVGAYGDPWQASVARHLGAGNALSFTPCRVGITLHVPCEKGSHVVDVDVPAGLHPNGIAQRMLRKGWTVGRKLACPEHSRKEKVKSARPVSPAATVALRARNATPEQRSEAGRALVAMREAKRKASTPTTSLPQEEPAIMATAPVVPPAPSEAARKAKRLIYQCLEDYYDDKAKAYRSGHSDESIAKETGASVAFVREIREADFGPIGMPPELSSIAAELDALRKSLADEQANHARTLNDYDIAIAKACKRLSDLCRAKGWPEPV